MFRPTSLTTVLFLGLALLLISYPGMSAEMDEPAPDLPEFAERTVTGESVRELADFISGYLADSGTIPDWAQIQTVDFQLRSISAAEIFVVFARTTYLWQAMGQLPETIPLTPNPVNPPIIDPIDVPGSESSSSPMREILTAQFLAQCAATVGWIDRLHVVPTAVWVDGERLSAAEYLAGLTICIQYAYYEGKLYDRIQLPRYTPPQAWVAAVTRATAPAKSSNGSAQSKQSKSMQTAKAPVKAQKPIPIFTPPAAVVKSEASRSSNPRLSLIPSSGATLSGVVGLVANYAGPSPTFVTFMIDGKSRAYMNFPPYSYRWDTTAIEPGKHTVVVRALGEGDAVLIEKASEFTIVRARAEPTDLESENQF